MLQPGPVQFKDILNPTSPILHHPRSSQRIAIKVPPMANVVHSQRLLQKQQKQQQLQRQQQLEQLQLQQQQQSFLRRSQRIRHSSDSQPSGSEYHESEKSMDRDVLIPDGPNSPIIETRITSRGRTVARVVYYESEDEVTGANDVDQEVIPEEPPLPIEDEDDSEQQPILRRLRSRPQTKQNVVLESEDEFKQEHNRSTRRNQPKKPASRSKNASRQPAAKQSRSKRLTRRSGQQQEGEADEYVDHPSTGGSADEDASFEDAMRTSSEPDPEDPDLDADGEIDVDADADGELDLEVEADGKPYALRQRTTRVNYVIPTLDNIPTKPKTGGRGGGRSGHGGSNRPKGLGWSATGAELGRWMGLPAEDSDSDHGMRTPRKPAGYTAPAGGMYSGAGLGGGMMAGDLAAAAGTPSNLGKIGDAALADADPLGVNVNVTFDEVGGLDEHIHSLKEMTLLPLLYPEVFQRFNVTPPRGVLFHGPPGTGKTLLARALAASCRTDGKQIAFYMRKGADCLSKWVGEAERQLRLLFEEAKNSQPSIIFFDEIDGLAPVRSSKQDQIHASIVSTLLALMDGMDGRGQVVVIGATNRPDAVDPALRRPGRFDREFYFPLPGLEAREKILGIMTKGWQGWFGDEGKENLRGLAKMTKGYGGADLRALCTEASLNAIQRRYPQIYRSKERLLLEAETIDVGLRDFMISIKKLVPSSARSSASAAAPLPPQFVPLLSDALESAKATISRVLPVEKKRNALEEAEWEDDGGEAGALERELLLQSMETLRIYRPRMVVHGPPAMGQPYIGAAILHHLEGYHVQSLELGTLFGNSTQTVEASIVQLFVEAKRHQPSVIYIPSLMHWCATIPETARSTVRAMLDTLAPTEPILLLAIVDGPFSSLPRDVRSWFGPTSDNRVRLSRPDGPQREAFFDGLLSDVQRPPNKFADGVERKKRVLEVLPVAPPLKPREPTAAELAVQEESDQRIIVLLQYRLGPILSELKRKFKRFTKKISEEYGVGLDDFGFPVMQNGPAAPAAPAESQPEPNGIVATAQEQSAQEPLVNGIVNGPTPTENPPHPEVPSHGLYDMDLEKMHVDLYKRKYLTPGDFLDDIRKIVHNAQLRFVEDTERFYKAQAMLTAAQVSVNEFDLQLKMDCDRMAPRERKRREERKRSKEKEKGLGGPSNATTNNGNGNGVGYAPGTRRSARQNGQHLEISITDPLKIERRHKRQRAGAAIDSQGSEEGSSDGRTSKRSKMVVSDDEDPLNELGLGPTSQPRPLVVRFASASAESPSRGREQHPATGEREEDLSLVPVAMAVDEESVPPRRSGFDPFLLNPLPVPVASPIPTAATSNPFSAGPPLFLQDGAVAMVDDNPFDVFRSSFSSSSIPVNHSSQTSASASAMHISRTVTPTPGHHVQESQQQPSQPPRATPTPTPVPIVVDPAAELVVRTPTPTPEFVVDQVQLSKLKDRLRDETGDLSVEELEQLRATCLGCVWRHRRSWERGAMLEELEGVVGGFLREVGVDDEEEGV